MLQPDLGASQKQDLQPESTPVPEMSQVQFSCRHSDPIVALTRDFKFSTSLKNVVFNMVFAWCERHGIIIRDRKQPRSPSHLAKIEDGLKHFDQLRPEQQLSIDKLTGTPEAYSYVRYPGRMRAYSRIDDSALPEEAREVRAALIDLARMFNASVNGSN